MRSIFRIPSDDMAGNALRRVPVHHYTRRKSSVLVAFGFNYIIQRNFRNKRKIYISGDFYCSKKLSVNYFIT